MLTLRRRFVIEYESDFYNGSRRDWSGGGIRRGVRFQDIYIISSLR